MSSRLFSIMALCLCLLFSLYANAQFKILRTGDRVPDIAIPNVLNYDCNLLRLSELHGKPVILDFWGTGCKSCFEAFPKLENLQRIYEGKVLIILVNKEDADSTARFFRKHAAIKRPSLPMVSGDNILFSLFPSNYYPWHIWINPKGIVSYITDGHNATTENVASFLRGEKLNVSQIEYLPEMTPGEYDKPLLIKENLFKNIEYYSYISRAIPGFSIGERNGSLADSQHIRLSTSSTILGLYKKAFSEKGKYNFEQRNCIFLEVSDTSRYFPPKDRNKLDAWIAGNGYSYDLFIPKSMSARLYKIMQEDLARFFGIRASVEKRKIKCFALVRTTNLEKIRVRDEMIKLNAFRKDSLHIHYYNRPISDFSGFLNNIFAFQHYPMPVIDATGYTENIDIMIDKKVITEFNMDALRRQLQKYDLDIIQIESYTDVLVLKE